MEVILPSYIGTVANPAEGPHDTQPVHFIECNTGRFRSRIMCVYPWKQAMAVQRTPSVLPNQKCGLNEWVGH